ncbi:glutamyl-tRNA reductase [Leucobacter viscericola]|uniref:glutamyl-tRNA reductase n=1 Tax=Leucobacter viscericola TaxID=2714935 RepID=UPI001FCB4853|nr:glutamyl-tRNA reductase [Leucobacter viscericola]
MLVCLSLEHRNVDLDFLGTIERHTAPVVEALTDPTLTDGSVVLATCNRFEAYLDVDSPDAVNRSISRISGVTGIEERRLRDRLVLRSDLDAVEHLFSVAGGLESVVVGEGEIAGQVRRALEQARDQGSTSSELERLFQFAARTSRQIKHRTGVQTAGRSLVRLALAMAQSRIGDWATTRVVLVGTGMYAGASLAALRARGATRVSVYSPSGRAEGFAASHGISAIAAHELEEALAEADLIVTTSLAQEPILQAELLSRTQRPARRPFCETVAGLVPGPNSAGPSSTGPKRGRTTTAKPGRTVLLSAARPRLIIDLGVPRNVEQAAELVSGIELLDLDLIAKHAPLAELSAESEARGIVRDAVEEFSAMRAENDAMPALVALRSHVYELLDDELQRLAPGGGGSAEAPGDPDGTTAAASNEHVGEAAKERAAIEAALRHFAGRLLHRPSVRIREAGRAGNAPAAHAAVDLLFDVRG